jgi:GntR family transcriptional regulator/MocR family aminotransferase
MSQTWAISGVDLHLDLRGSRVRGALETSLRDAVKGGRLQPGTRLPPSRTLATDLGISRNTVAAAYAQLVAEGWLEARQGSGTRVAAHPARRPVGDRTQPDPPAPPRFDLRAGAPDVASFPRAEWIASARRALRDAPAAVFGYGEVRGRRELREAVAEYLARARGVDVTPDRVVVCAGFTDGLRVLGLALRAGGASTVAVEGYGHRLHREIVAAAGLDVVTVGVDDDGAAVDGLGGADAAVLTPAHQFPLGSVLTSERRLRAIEWARAGGRMLIEDDYDGEFRYDRQPVGALQALAPDHVVYAGTASKSLAPGMRLGWLVVPSRLLDAVLEQRVLGGAPSTIDQIALADFLRSGAYDRHVRRARLAYRRRRDRLLAALPGLRVRGAAAGLHVVVELPPEMTEREAVDRAHRHGVFVEPLSAYGAGDHFPALVVGYGTPPEHAFTTAVARLAAALTA